MKLSTKSSTYEIPRSSTQKHSTNSQELHMKSTIGKAIALLHKGIRPTHSMIAELRDQGIDIPSFYSYHLNKG